MLIESLDFPNFRAFVRLLRINFGKNSKPDLQTEYKLIHLASDHGISRDEARMILDFCLEDINQC